MKAGKQLMKRHACVASLLIALTAEAATVTGNLTDISIGALDTKMIFAPTNEVLVTPSGLSAGPPKIIQTSSGQFSITLEAGDYTVSLPMIPWRRPFVVSVPSTNGTLNITNLVSNLLTYTYTNSLNYSVKVTGDDAGPDALNAKVSVAGSLRKLLTTNSGVVTMVLSNPPALRVNAAQVICWSTNGESSLLDGTASWPAGALHAGSLLSIEAFGSFSDPGGNAPVAQFKLKLGSTVIAAQSKGVNTGSWHLSAAITIRSTGVSGAAVGTLMVAQDNFSLEPFAGDSQTATVNTTGALSVGLTAAIDDYTGAESVTCEQALVKVE